MTVVGPVAALRERLAWFEQRPLRGRRVAVTRARAQASGLAARLRQLGAEVIEAPAIRIEPRRRRRRRRGGRRRLAGGPLRRRVPHEPQRRAAADRRARAAGGLDARALAGHDASRRSGPGTAARARGAGASRPTSCRSARSPSRLPRSCCRAGRAGQARADRAGRRGARRAAGQLRAAGAEVDVVALYETVREHARRAAARAAAGRRLRHLHQLVDRAFSARGARRRRALPAPGAGRLDRPGDEPARRASWASPVARRGRAPRRRRARRRAAARRAGGRAGGSTCCRSRFLSDYGHRRTSAWASATA